MAGWCVFGDGTVMNWVTDLVIVATTESKPS